MKIPLNLVASLVLIAAGAYLGGRLLQASPSPEGDPPARETGPHGGRWLEADGLQLEVWIHERGGPPHFRVYPYRGGEPVDPAEVDVVVELARLGGRVERIRFAPDDGFLRGSPDVAEPHSFDVRVHARHQGRDRRWAYPQYEGRTRIDAAQAEGAGIETAAAGPAEILRTVTLQGRVRHDPGRLTQVRARFPGVVRAMNKSVGDAVSAGETLARVESNESLQSYAVTAPGDGVVIEQGAAVGETVGDEPLYLVANLDRVWVDLAVFRDQMREVQAGQPARVATLDDRQVHHARIDFVSPITEPHSQSTTARVYLDNADGSWRPGTAVTATVTVERERFPLAVENRALQRFRDFDVVYARFGEIYEVRMVELGRSDARHTEVLGGLEPGTEYVTGNSYLIKADVDKSAAAHGH